MNLKKQALNGVKWTVTMLKNKSVFISNYGETSRDFRPGDVRHSQADVSKANSLLGYDPKFNISQGINEAMAWYIKSLKI